MVSGEVRNPERNIPIALIFGVALVGILYMLVNAAVQYVLPASNIAASPRPASDAMALVLGSLGAGIVSASMALSMLVAMNGTVMSGARVPFAVARDRYFFSGLAEVHPRFHTPSVAIVVQAVLTIVSVVVWWQFPPVFFPGDIRRVAVLHDCKQHGVCVSPPRSASPATISRLGIPRGSCALRLHLRCCCITHSRETFVYRHLVAWPSSPASRFSMSFPGYAETSPEKSCR